MTGQSRTASRRDTSSSRVNVRLDPALRARVDYWADKRGVSVNSYIADAVAAAIARENGDYDLPTLEQARLAQLIESQTSLASNVANLEKVVMSMADSIVGLMRGDSYLLDPEDGEGSD